MTKSVWAKTSCAFENPAEHEYASDYLSALRDNWCANENSITRFSGLIIGLAALFEIFFTRLASTVTVTLFGVKLSSSDVLRAGLLIVIAYLYYSISYSAIESTIFQKAHDAVIYKIYPDIYRQDNERQLHPANSLLSSPGRVMFALGSHSVSGILGWIIGFLRPVVLAIGPTIFLAIAFLQLFHKYGLGVIFRVSVIISGILCLAAWINLWIALIAAFARTETLGPDDNCERKVPSSSSILGTVIAGILLVTAVINVHRHRGRETQR